MEKEEFCQYCDNSKDCRYDQEKLVNEKRCGYSVKDGVKFITTPETFEIIVNGKKIPHSEEELEKAIKEVKQ